MHQIRADEPDEEANSAAETSRIHGTVRWMDNRPINDCQIELHRRDSVRRRWQAKETSVAVTADGKFQIESLPRDEYWCLAVRTPDAGVTLRQIVVKSGETESVNFVLYPPASAHIRIHDDEGLPIAGARIRHLEFVDGTEGSFNITRGDESVFGFTDAPSDQEGRLPIEGFSSGLTLKSMWIDHSNFAAATLKPELQMRSSEMAAVELKPGLPLHFRFAERTEDKSLPDLKEVVVQLRHSNLREADSILSVPYPVQHGMLAVRLQPGAFSMLRIESDSAFMLPSVSLEYGEALNIAPQHYDYWTFRCLPKVLVRGRVVKEDGTPVASEYLTGSIRNVLADGSPVPREWEQWAQTELRKTDSQGEYEISLAPGDGRIEYLGYGVPSVEQLNVDVRGTVEQRVPDIVVRDLPAIRGIVLGADGLPASGAVVRLHSNSSARYFSTSVVTGSDGRFDLPVTHMPHHPDTEERVYVNSVFAFLADQSIGGVTTVDLRDSAGAQNLTVAMQKQAIDWPLSAMSEAFYPWERGDAGSWPDRKQTPENQAGVTVPNLDGSLWLNTDKHSLNDFLGQYVLLDFYTTGCGPCNADFPRVRMVYDVLGQSGVAVIAVHDNSSAVEEIREHAAKKGMEMPIVIDHPDGRMLKPWNDLGLVSGYPSYVLLDPEGRLVAADGTIAAPMLRVYKLEIIRQELLRRNARQGN